MRVFTVLALALLLAVPAFAAKGDDLAGVWVTEDGKSRVEITEIDGKYNGKIVWLKEPSYPAGDEEAGKPKHDRFNPDPKLKDKPIIGLQVLKGFKADSDTRWSGGTIYDPENGKTYSCRITLEGDGTLYVRGFIGISLIGRTTEWTRYVPESEEAAAKPALE